jgi:hypothetical protein
MKTNNLVQAQRLNEQLIRARDRLAAVDAGKLVIHLAAIYSITLSSFAEEPMRVELRKAANEEIGECLAALAELGVEE